MININTLVIILLLTLGFIFLYIDQYKRYKVKETEKQIIYRYIPKTPEQDLAEEIFPSDIFETMFSRPSPWVTSVNELDTKRQKEINKYFVSQI